ISASVRCDKKTKQNTSHKNHWFWSEWILNAFSKVPPKPKVFANQSNEFQELESVPTSATIEGPLEPTSSTGTITDAPEEPLERFFSVSNVQILKHAILIPMPAPSPPLPATSVSLAPMAGRPLDISEVSSSNHATLVKPSFFVPPPLLSTSLPLSLPSAPMAPPLNPLTSLQPSLGAPLLQPFPPPAPSQSLASASSLNQGPIITRDGVRDALVRLVKELFKRLSWPFPMRQGNSQTMVILEDNSDIISAQPLWHKVKRCTEFECRDLGLKPISTLIIECPSVGDSDVTHMDMKDLKNMILSRSYEPVVEKVFSSGLFRAGGHPLSVQSTELVLMRDLNFDWFMEGITNDGSNLFDPEYRAMEFSPLPSIPWNTEESGDIMERPAIVIQRSREWFKRKRTAFIEFGGLLGLSRQVSHTSSLKASEKVLGSTHSKESSKRKNVEEEHIEDSHPKRIHKKAKIIEDPIEPLEQGEIDPSQSPILRWLPSVSSSVTESSHHVQDMIPYHAPESLPMPDVVPTPAKSFPWI
ncbi:hypothetical protein KI387_025074, partial [Taxus chinensis]